MRLTVITNTNDKVIATHKGHVSKDKLHAGLMAGPNQTLHEIEVPDEVENIKDPSERHTCVQSYIRKKN